MITTNMQTTYLANFVYNTKKYPAVVKVNTFCNGYRLAKVIIDKEQHWALYDGISWRLMADMRKNMYFDRIILKHLKALTKVLSHTTNGNR